MIIQANEKFGDVFLALRGFSIYLASRLKKQQKQKKRKDFYEVRTTLFVLGTFLD